MDETVKVAESEITLEALREADEALRLPVAADPISYPS